MKNLEFIPDVVRRLEREVSDAEWDQDPRLEFLTSELNYYKDKQNKGELYEPSF